VVSNVWNGTGHGRGSWVLCGWGFPPDREFGGLDLI